MTVLFIFSCAELLSFFCNFRHPGLIDVVSSDVWIWLSYPILSCPVLCCPPCPVLSFLPRPVLARTLFVSLSPPSQGKFPGSVEEMLAFVSYLPLAGDGCARGDGIIPRDVAILEGSTIVELPTSKHSGILGIPSGGASLSEACGTGHDERGGGGGGVLIRCLP